MYPILLRTAVGSFFKPVLLSGTDLRLPPVADFFVGLIFGLKELGLGFGFFTDVTPNGLEDGELGVDGLDGAVLGLRGDGT